MTPPLPPLSARALPPESSSASSAFPAETCRWGCARPLPWWSAKVKERLPRVPPGGSGPGSGVRRCARERQSGPSEQFEVTTRFLCGGTAEGDTLLGLLRAASLPRLQCVKSRWRPLCLGLGLNCDRFGTPWVPTVGAQPVWGLSLRPKIC